MEDPVGRQLFRVMPKGEPGLRTRKRGEAGPGAGESAGEALGCPWSCLVGEIDMVGEEQVSYYGLQSVSQLFGSLRMMCLNWLHHPRGGYFE